MNVAICLVNISIGGVWTCLRNIIDSLEHSGRYRFSVIIKERSLGDESHLEYLAEKNIPLHLVPKFEVPKPTSRFKRRFWKLRRWIAQKSATHKIERLVKNADLIIDYLDGYFAEDLKNVHIPKIFWFHQGAYVWKKRLAQRANVVLPVFDHIVCLTSSFHDFFADEYPQYADKAVTLYNFLDFKRIRRLAENTPPALDAPYFVFAGRLSVDKDHDTAIEAFRKFALHNHDVKLVFVGDGPRRDEIETLIRKSGLKDRIILTGAVENPYGIIKNAVAHILSSYGEGLPTVLLEAAALEVPNISADCPNGPDEILLHGEAGLLFPPGDSDMLAQHMSTLWADPGLGKKLAQKAAQSLSRFEADTVIPQLETLMQKSRRSDNASVANG